MTEQVMPISEKYQQRIEGALERSLLECQPQSLQDAMRYAVLAGGKRIRPLLVYAAGDALEINSNLLDNCAVAIELIHAYSLIHDDLPCMDDDDLRRGKPTTHIAYGEATAVLAGDALQALAFDILSSPVQGICAENQLKILNILASAAGANGMVMGQAIDLDAVGNDQMNESELALMHQHKTGALIRAAVCMPSYCHKVIDDSQLQKHREDLSAYALAIGLAFQVRDDILDIQSDTDTLGKPQGADEAAGKPTYPSIMGMDAAKEKLFKLHQKALDSLIDFGEKADLLREIAAYIVKRIA